MLRIQPAPDRGWHKVSLHAAVTSGIKPASDDFGDKPLRLVAGHLLPAQTDFRHRKISLESFSSIGHRMVQSRNTVGRAAAFRLIDAGRREDDEPSAIPSPESMDPDIPDGLPGGTRYGVHVSLHFRAHRLSDRDGRSS